MNEKYKAVLLVVDYTTKSTFDEKHNIVDAVELTKLLNDGWIIQQTTPTKYLGTVLIILYHN